MTCTLYKDYVRECVQTFKDVIHLGNHDICSSDKYKECPFYRYINEPENVCEYADRCLQGKTIHMISFERLIQISKAFCGSKNNINCARYKLFKSNKNVPTGLRVDGSMIEEKTI